MNYDVTSEAWRFQNYPILFSTGTDEFNIGLLTILLSYISTPRSVTNQDDSHINGKFNKISNNLHYTHRFQLSTIILTFKNFE